MNSFKTKIQAFLENRKSSNATATALIICAVMVVNVLLCYVTQAFGLFFYQAEYTEDFTISGMSDELFNSAKDEGKSVTLTFLMERDTLAQHATGSFVLDTAEQFKERYGDFIKLRFVNTLTKLDEDGNRVELEKYKTDNPEGEVILSRSAVIFESSDGNHRVLSNVRGGTGFVDFFTFDSAGSIVSFNGETVISSMICWVLADEHKTAYVTANHAEENDANFATLLAASGYYIKNINLQDTDVPDDAGMLIISNPKYDFERAKPGIVTEIERLEEYVSRGGNLYISLDPYVKELNNLEDFIATHGIELQSKSTDNGDVRLMVRDPENAITLDGYTLLVDFASGGIADSIAATTERYSKGEIILKDASALKLTGNATPLLVTSPSSVCTAASEIADSAGSYVVAAHSTYTKNDGAPTANIFVVSSVYISASDALTSNSYSNRDFTYALFEHAFGAQNLPYGANSVTYVTDDLKNLTMGEARLYAALLISLPIALAAVGAVIIIRRKNR